MFYFLTLAYYNSYDYIYLFYPIPFDMYYLGLIIFDAFFIQLWFDFIFILSTSCVWVLDPE